MQLKIKISITTISLLKNKKYQTHPIKNQILN